MCKLVREKARICVCMCLRERVKDTYKYRRRDKEKDRNGEKGIAWESEVEEAVKHSDIRS